MAHAEHASTKLYWHFAWILTVITVLEYEIVHWLPSKAERAVVLPVWVVFTGLVVMSLIKFIMVVGWYMHLKYDHRIVKQTFVVSLIMAALTGLALGVLVYPQLS